MIPLQYDLFWHDPSVTPDAPPPITSFDVPDAPPPPDHLETPPLSTNSDVLPPSFAAKKAHTQSDVHRILAKTPKTPLTIGGVAYTFSLQQKWTTTIELKIKSESMRNFSTFTIVIEPAHLRKSINASNDTHYSVSGGDIISIQKTDRYNGGATFSASWWQNIGSFNYFRKFFGYASPHSVLTQEIRIFLQAMLLQHEA